MELETWLKAWSTDLAANGFVPNLASSVIGNPPLVLDTSVNLVKPLFSLFNVRRLGLKADDSEFNRLPDLLISFRAGELQLLNSDAVSCE